VSVVEAPLFKQRPAEYETCVSDLVEAILAITKQLKRAARLALGVLNRPGA
jgi:hypothetical protein